jgi:ABC-type phosphonate transport system ATPase subunit
MKKLLGIAAFTLVVCIAAVSASGRGEISMTSQREQQRRDLQDQEQKRQKVQRDQWQNEQDQHGLRHERPQSYESWLEQHQREYRSR